MSDRITPHLVLHAYCIGLFPAADQSAHVHWFDPDPRCVFPLDGLRVSRSLRQVICRGVFEVKVNAAFDQVIEACASRPQGTWISRQVLAVYRDLHRMGYAHSVETWRDGGLEGGLYGVAIGGAFFGESMFHRATNASKVALVALVERLQSRGFTLLDAQWTTPHLLSLGAVEIPRRVYLRQLAVAIGLSRNFADTPDEGKRGSRSPSVN